MKWPASFTINQIALLLITGLLILVSLIGSFAAYQTRAVTRSLEQHSQEAARSELAASVQRLLALTSEKAAKLAEWDETRQQLVLPEYYAYWRDDRVYSSGMLNIRFARTALYTPAGALLAPNKGDGFPPAFPANVSRYQVASWLVNESGTIALYQAFPIYSDVRRQDLLGHGMLRIDFMQALLREQTFLFTDAASVSLPLKPAETLDASKLLSKLKFKARPDQDQVRFQAILSQTLLALFVLLLVTALFVAAVYNRLLVRPLRRLSDDIDAMQRGRFTHNPASQQPMHIIELENIRHSLYDYQLQLRELHGSLEHQNREFHSQARQDALTGCYNRRAYDEDWQR